MNRNDIFFPKYNGTGYSIESALRSVGANYDYQYRKLVAAENGIIPYTGTATQNLYMLGLLCNGWLRRPKYECNSAKIPVVTLCGSTKFKDTFFEVANILALKGVVVLKPDIYSGYDEDTVILTSNELENLKKAHYTKIDMSDAVIVINKNGYIGKATREEIEYAVKYNKKIYYLEGYGNRSNGVLFDEFYANICRR